MAELKTNDEIATMLERIADLLAAQDSNPFRVRAYRSAANTIRNADKPVARLAQQEDVEALMALPNVGDALARLIIEYVQTGESDLLRELEAERDPVSVLANVPGIGQTLAQRIVDELDVQTLAELEMAAHDGRLDQVEGFGDERVKNVRTSLAGMLSDSAQRRARQRTDEPPPKPEEPSVGLLLDIDAEYRRKAEADELHRIAPRRFNPDDEAWLPIMNTKREGWSFTALYSNTARAHELDKTHDWVVIYYEREGQPERQKTVVTETQGALAGKRVVRGREAQTRDYYQSQQA